MKTHHIPLAFLAIAIAVMTAAVLPAQYQPRVPDVPRTPTRPPVVAGYAQSTSSAPETPRAKEFFGTFQRRFDPNRPVEVTAYITPFLLIVTLIGVAVVGIVIYNRLALKYANKNGYDSPRQLFNELCIAHELLRSERQFLKLFAETLTLPDPLALFIEPKFLIDSLQNPKFARHHIVIEGLLIKVFGIPEDVRDAASGNWESDIYTRRSNIETLGDKGSSLVGRTTVAPRSRSLEDSEIYTPTRPASFLRQLVVNVSWLVYRWDDFWHDVRNAITRWIGALTISPSTMVRTERRPSILFAVTRTGIPITELER